MGRKGSGGLIFWLNKFLICFILKLFPADDTHLRAPGVFFTYSSQRVNHNTRHSKDKTR